MSHLVVALGMLVLPLGASALSPVACTLEYAPVCGSLEVQCIQAPCDPISQTYSNRCFLEAEGAEYLHDGECTEQEYDAPAASACTREYAPVCGYREKFCETARCFSLYHTFSNICLLKADEAKFLYDGPCTEDEGEGDEGEGSYRPPENCTSWFDGCNHCSGVAGGPVACTLRACVGTQAPGYCISYASGEPGSNPPSVPPVLEAPIERPAEPPSVSPEETEEPAPEEHEDAKPRGFVESIWSALSTWISSFF